MSIEKQIQEFDAYLAEYGWDNISGPRLARIAFRAFKERCAMSREEKERVRLFFSDLGGLGTTREIKRPASFTQAVLEATMKKIDDQPLYPPAPAITADEFLQALEKIDE